MLTKNDLAPFYNYKKFNGIVVFAIDKIKSLSCKNNVSGHEHHYVAETWKEAG